MSQIHAGILWYDSGTIPREETSPLYDLPHSYLAPCRDSVCVSSS